MAEEKISELQGRLIEIMNPKNREKKGRMKKTSKHTNTRERKDQKKILEEIMAKNSPNLERKLIYTSKKPDSE